MQKGVNKPIKARNRSQNINHEELCDQLANHPCRVSRVGEHK